MAEENQNSTTKGVHVPRANSGSPSTHASPADNGLVVENLSLLSSTSSREQLDFEACYSVILAKNQSANESFNQIFELSTQIKSSIDSLAESRRKQIELIGQKEKMDALLNAFIRNDAWSLNRKAFDALCAEYSEGYLLLLDLASTEQEVAKKEQLLALIQEEEEKEAGDNWLEGDSDSEDEDEPITNAMLFLKASIYFYRSVEEGIVGAISSGISSSTKVYDFLTSTFDAEAKKLTRELAHSVLERLKTQLEELSTEQKELIEPFSIEEHKKRSLLAESPLKLSLIAQKNSLQGSKEELTPSITTAQPVTEAKKLIQATLNAGYKDVYKQIVRNPGDPMDGKALAFALTQEMGGVAQDLMELKKLKPQRDKLLEEKNNIERLISGLDQNIGNQLISSIAQQRLVQLKTALDNIENKVNRLFPKYKQQQRLFLNATEQELDELIEENKVDDFKIDNFPPFIESKPTKTLIKSVVTHYSSLIDAAVADADNQDDLLSELIQQIDAVNTALSKLPSIRTRFDPRALNLSKLDNTLKFLQSNQILGTLIQDGIKNLNNNLDLSQKELQVQVKKINIKAVSTEQLMTEDTANFAALREMNNELKGSIDCYTKLKQNVAYLSDIEAGIAATGTYITENTNWWVRLTDFLVQISSFFKCFKTDACRLVDEAKAIKKELEVCNAQCEQLIVAGLTQLEKNDIINETNLLDSIKENHKAIVFDDEIDTTSFERNKKQALTNLGLFKQKTTKEEKDEPDNSLESGYGSGY